MVVTQEARIEEPNNEPSEVESFAAALKEAVKQTGEDGRSIEAGRFRGDKGTTRRAAVESEPPTLTFTGEELAPVFFTLGNMTCERAGVTRISHEEARELASGFAPLLTKYGGEALQAYGAEIGAAVVVLKVSAPRIAEYAEKRRAKEQAKEQEQADRRAENPPVRVES